MGPSRFLFRDVSGCGKSIEYNLRGSVYQPVSPQGWRIEGVGVGLSVGYPNLVTIHTWNADERPRLDVRIDTYEGDQGEEILLVRVSGDITYSGPQDEWVQREEAKTKQGQIAQLGRKIKELEGQRDVMDRRVVSAEQYAVQARADREKLEEDISAVYAQLCELRREK